MATATNEIIQNQYGSDGKFTLMTTPLPSGEYMNSGGYAPILTGLIPIVVLLWANLGSVIADAAKEENEEKLENILKRIGYRPIVEVYRSFIVMTVAIVLAFIPATLIILFITLPQVNVLIGLCYFYLMPNEMWLLDLNFKFLFGKRYYIPKAIFYICNFFILISVMI